MEFGEKLQMLRKARGWSQEELAQQINVSRQALSKWESGASIADTENVIALSRLFGVSTDYLLLCESEAASAPAAGSAPTKESKWPVPRIVWLVVNRFEIISPVAVNGKGFFAYEQFVTMSTVSCLTHIEKHLKYSPKILGIKRSLKFAVFKLLQFQM